MNSWLPLPETPLFATLYNRLEQKDKWERVNMEDYADTLPNRGELLEMRPSLMTASCFQAYTNTHTDHHVVLGAFSFTDLTAQTKYVAQLPYTTSELANEYVRYCIEKQNLPVIVDRSQPLKGHGPPMYFRGAYRGELSYVDIQSCYFQIYRYLTIDGKYSRGTWSHGKLYLLDTDQLGQIKLVRNTLFGLMAGGHTTIHTKQHKLKFQHFPSLASHPAVGALVFDTVQAVALESLKLFPSIVAWLTDAAILSTKDVGSFQDFLASQWYLESVVKASSLDGEVYNLTSHRIGKKKTLDLVHGRSPVKSLPFRPITFDKQDINIGILKTTRNQARARYANHVG